MSLNEKKSQEFIFTGRHMLFSMIGFFGVIIAVNFTMAYLAKGSWTGLVVKNSYVASQHFNEGLEKAEAQRRAGLSSSLAYARGKLLLELKTGDAFIPNAYELVADIGRPAYEQEDQTLSFAGAGAHAYVLDINLDPGVWQVTVRSQTSGFAYRRDARIFVTETGEGYIE
ncbi:MAG: FixH family protein [Pseudomonadota bacterium]